MSTERPESSRPLEWTTDHVPGHGQYPYHAHASLAFPVNAQSMSFWTEGSLAHGSFEVSQVDGEVRTDALVDVDVWYKVEEALDPARAAVNHVHFPGNKHGLQIVTPHAHHGDERYQLRFRLRLILPRVTTNTQTPLMINSLTTQLPQFSHHISQLADGTVFKHVALASTNAAVRVDSVNINVGTIRTSNASIAGNFAATQSLSLATQNGAILADVALPDEGGRGTGGGPSLTMHTSNAEIRSGIILSTGSLRASGSGGTFRVQARTANGPVELSFPHAPANSLLNVSASSANAPVRITTHPAFEGTFDVQSTWFTPPSVVQGGPAEDPLGRRRRRDVRMDNSHRGVVRGQVAWEPRDPDAKQGRIVAQTSNAPAVLIL
ncbi:hypothetical protein GY45DRAFT_755003 [Cubamyces sp. BRFM 1775]|nr:hypothetical protein GY45DRAFT_755003 [Cubamyces sp. BRFM 1775]